MTTNEGFWANGVYGTADRLNASLLQIGAVSALPAAGQEGRMYMSTDTATKGRIYRDTGAAWVEVLSVDAAAGTASLRTLSTTATSAAAGDHTHLPDTPNQLIQVVSGFVNVDDETTVGTGTIAVQGASEELAVFAAVSLPDGNSTWTVRLKFSGPTSGTVGTITGQSAGTTNVIAVPASGTAGIITPTTAGTYTVFVTVERTTTGGTPYVNARGQYYAREVGA